MNHHFEFIRSSLHEMCLAGYLGDTDIVCDDGRVTLNRLVLQLMFPELRSLLVESDECAVILPGFHVDKFNAMYTLFFVNDRLNLNKFEPRLSDLVRENVETINCGENVKENIDFKQTKNDLVQKEPLVMEDKESTFVKDHVQKTKCTQHGSKVQQYVAKRCNKVHDSSNNHKTCHKEVTVSTNNLSCTWCEKSFDLRSTLVVHEVTVHRDISRLEESKKERITRCGLCGKLFMSYSDYRVHILYHLKDRSDKENIAEIILNSQFSFQCSSCESKFSTKESLDRHIIKFHLNPKGSVCDVCKKSFLSKELCAKHKLNIHNDGTMLRRVKESKGVSIEIFTCKTCQKAFSEKDKLNQHVKDHQDPLSKRKHKCSHCPKSFPSPAAKVLHERSHTGEKPFKCNFCGLGFAAKGNLVSHKKSHLNKKDYACSFCGKGFNTKRDRKTHEAHTHSNIRAYICDNCGEGYKRVMNLKRHKTVCKRSLQCFAGK